MSKEEFLKDFRDKMALAIEAAYPTRQTPKDRKQ